MFPYSPRAAEDEPTMTDLRGVMPTQRPPVDATVLEEPTSEVPLITPRTDPDPDAVPDAADSDPDAVPDAAGGTDPDAVPDVAGGPDAAGGTDPDAGPDAAGSVLAGSVLASSEPAGYEAAGFEPAGYEAAGLEPAGYEAAGTEPAALAAPVGTEPAGTEPAGPDPATTEPASTEPAAADPATAGPTSSDPATRNPGAAGAGALSTTPPPAPEVNDVVQPSFPYRSSEMAKMTWQPAAPRIVPPDPAPASPLAEAEPAPEPAAAPFAGPPLPAATLSASAPPWPDAGPALTGPAAVDPALDGPLLDGPAAVDPALDGPTLDDSAVTGPAVDDDLRTSGPAAVVPEQVGTGRPGDVKEQPIALWSDPAAEHLRDRWREVQGQFIDDPDAAVAGARALVTEAVRTLADTLLSAQDELDPFRGNGRVDTETMRVAMRRYREFLERVLAL